MWQGRPTGSKPGPKSFDFSFRGNLEVDPYYGTKQKYKHMIVLYTSKYARPYAQSGPNYYNTQDQNWILFKAQDDDPDIEFIDRSSDYYKVRPRQTDMDNSIKKKDVPRVVPKGLFKEYVKLAILFVTRRNAYIYSTPNEPENGFEFVLNTSPGLPWIKMGYTTKAEVLACPKARALLMELAWDTEIPMLDTCNDKEEFLPYEDLTRDVPKLRTTFGASFQSLFKENYLFAEQNEKLRKYHEEHVNQYGFVKQYGGFDRLAKRISKHGFRWESDVSGLDRVICLKPVYKVREKLLNLEDPFDRELFEYVRYFQLNPHFLDHYGNVIRCKTGNHSGRLTTTTDNGLALEIVNMYGRIKLLHQRGVPLCDITFEDVVDPTEEAYFGDDSFDSIDPDFVQMSLSDWEQFVRQYYADWGLTIKDGAFYATEGLPYSRLSPKHSFLGSYFAYDNFYEAYIPTPRLGKICSSITQVPIRSMTEEVYFTRIATLTILAYPNERIFKVLTRYVLWYMNQRPALRPMFLGIFEELSVEIGLRRAFSSLYFGFEGRKTTSHAQPLFFLAAPTIMHEYENLFSMLSTQASEDAPKYVRNQKRENLGEKFIRSLETSGNATPADIAWLKLNVDPNHDTPVACEGKPDGMSKPSVVHHVKQSVQISRPPAFADDAPWDFMVINNPVLNRVILGRYQLFGNTMTQVDPDGAHNVYPINVLYKPSSDVDFDTTLLAGTGVAPDDEFLDGTCRCIYQAFELIDTTAVINKQGSFNGAKMNQAPARLTTINNGIGMFEPVPEVEFGLSFAASYYEIQMAPKNLSELTLIPNYCTWEAQHGSYHVISLEDDTTTQTALPTYPLLAPRCFTPGMLTNDSTGELQVFAPQPVTHTWEGEAAQFYPANPQIIVSNPAQMSIAMYLGLHPLATFKLECTFGIQRNPDPINNPSINNLAKMPPVRNETVLEVAYKVMKKSRAAVPSYWNHDGYWWLEELQKIASIAAPFAMLIPEVGAPLAGALAAAGSMKFGDGDPAKKEKRKRKKQKANEEKRELQKDLLKLQAEYHQLVRERDKRLAIKPAPPPLPPIKLSKQLSTPKMKEPIPANQYDFKKMPKYSPAQLRELNFQKDEAARRSLQNIYDTERKQSKARIRNLDTAVRMQREDIAREHEARLAGRLITRSNSVRK